MATTACWCTTNEKTNDAVHTHTPTSGCPIQPVPRPSWMGPAPEATQPPKCECVHLGGPNGRAHDWTPGGTQIGGVACPEDGPVQYLPKVPLAESGALPADKQEAIDDLLNWWTSLAEQDAQTTVPKAVEYGSADLIEIGRAMARATGRTDLTDAQAAELGIYFYVVGKLGRWTAAVEENRQVSDDTLFDLGVYVTMVRRIRATGGWPYATGGKQ